MYHLRDKSYLRYPVSSDFTLIDRPAAYPCGLLRDLGLTTSWIDMLLDDPMELPSEPYQKLVCIDPELDLLLKAYGI